MTLYKSVINCDCDNESEACPACGKTCRSRIQNRNCPGHKSTTISNAKPELCCYRGDRLREEECRTCAGNVRVFVFACELRGECTISRSVGLPICRSCPLYEKATG